MKSTCILRGVWVGGLWLGLAVGLNGSAVLAQPTADDAEAAPDPQSAEAAEPAPPVIEGSDVVTPETAVEPLLPADLGEVEPLPVESSLFDRLRLEDLMSLQVTSVAGVGQDWFRTPAALSVVTHEDIRRSGLQTLPELLRLVPGTFVGQFNAQNYAISPRGFASQGANKQLMLIDGRIAYDPLFSGVLWDAQDVLLEDIDRIEVIRGPGPTLWGTNAVNGVINVTSRSARVTQGLYATGAVGNVRQQGAVRYGDRLSEDSWYRVWGKYYQHDEMENAAGQGLSDDWSIGRGGFQIDGEGDDYTSWMLQGGLYNSFTKGEVVTFPVPNMHAVFATSVDDARISGGHLLFQAARHTPEGEGWNWTSYYDRTDRVTNVGFEVGRDTFASDWRHYFNLTDRQQLMWGLSAWVSSDRTEPGGTVFLPDSNRVMETYSGFVQDTITLVPDQWFLMAGSKFEWNDRSGFEVQPSIRTWWTPDDSQTLWAAVTRAVRVPSRLEEDAVFPLIYVDTGLIGGGPASGVIVPLSVTGNDDLRAENLLAYEAGYRLRVLENLSVSTAFYYNRYDDIITFPAAGFVSFSNDGRAKSWGTEVVVRWDAADNWRLEAQYSFIDMDVDGPLPGLYQGQTPQQQASIRSFLDLTADLEFNSLLYFVDHIPAQDIGDYVRLDLGVTWRVNDQLELALWGQNLFEPSHREFQGTSEVERTFYVQATLRY